MKTLNYFCKLSIILFCTNVYRVSSGKIEICIQNEMVKFRNNCTNLRYEFPSDLQNTKLIPRMSGELLNLNYIPTP